ISREIKSAPGDLFVLQKSQSRSKYRMLCAVLCGVGALALCVAPLLAWDVGRMTGGGSIFGFNQQGQMIRVTHCFELHCGTTKLATTPARGPNTLEINWDGGSSFHLDTLTSIDCESNDTSPEPPPNTSQLFDTYNGCGNGTVNGEPGFHACWTFTDHGEPGDNDTAQYYIEGPVSVVLNVPAANLTFGNHQVHKEN